jgi:UvrD/REP helicase N-terminal domain
MLIGEIVPQLYQYLRDNPAAPKRSLYDHILVDEYQDLNRAEQAVVDLLRGSAELCIVGDDQSLYSFKFAHPAGIRNSRFLIPAPLTTRFSAAAAARKVWCQWRTPYRQQQRPGPAPACGGSRERRRRSGNRSI